MNVFFRFSASQFHRILFPSLKLQWYQITNLHVAELSMYTEMQDIKSFINLSKEKEISFLPAVCSPLK